MSGKSGKEKKPARLLCRVSAHMKNPNRNATFFLLDAKNSSLGERRAARGGSTRPDERNRQ